MNIEETTLYHPRWFRQRFRYYESGHTCSTKVTEFSQNKRIKCDCRVYYIRTTRNWYKPIEYIIKRLWRFYEPSRKR